MRLIIAALVLVSASSASAESRAVRLVKGAMEQGMEHYDLADFAEARRSLNNAITIAKKNGIEEEPIAAQVYVRLGIVYFTQEKPDEESAKVAFINALSIDPKISIPRVYSRKAMSAMFEELRKQRAGTPSAASCQNVEGITHAPIDDAYLDEAMPVRAKVGSDLNASSVRLHYRSQGNRDFATVTMKAGEGCTYTGSVPSKALKGRMLQYYIAAYNKRGKVISQKGSAGVPIPVTLSKRLKRADGSSNIVDEDENPFASTNKTNKTNKKKKSVIGPVKPEGPPSFYVRVGLGSGAGFVTGETEQLGESVDPGFAPAWLHVSPELGYYLNEKIAIAATFRLGFTVGANLMGKASAAPAGIVRVRYGLGKDGDGLQLHGGVGFGFVRQVLSVNTNGDKDTTVSGPAIVAVGAGYQFRLTRSLRFLTEVDALIGVPIVSELGSVTPHFGTQFDVNAGFLFAF